MPLPAYVKEAFNGQTSEEPKTEISGLPDYVKSALPDYVKKAAPEREENPDWMKWHPTLAGLYGAGKGLLEQAVIPSIEAGGMIAGSLSSPIVGTALGYGIAANLGRQLKDAYARLGEDVKYPTVKEATIQSASDVGTAIVLGKVMDTAIKAAPVLEEYLFHSLPKRLYGSAIKTPLSKKWIKTLPDEVVSRQTQVIEEGLNSRVPPSEYGVSKIKNLQKEVGDYIDDITKTLSEDPKNFVNREAVLEKGLERAYEKAANSSDPEGAKALVDVIAKRFRSHPENLTPAVANQIKRQLYDEVAWNGTEPSALAAQLNTVGKKGVAREIMLNLEELYPALAELNATDAARISLIEVIEKSFAKEAQKSMVPLGAKVLMRPRTWPLAIWEATVGHPQVKARLAFALHKANPAKYPAKPPKYVEPPVEPPVEPFKQYEPPSRPVTKATPPNITLPKVESPGAVTGPQINGRYTPDQLSKMLRSDNATRQEMAIDDIIETRKKVEISERERIGTINDMMKSFKNGGNKRVEMNERDRLSTINDKMKSFKDGEKKKLNKPVAEKAIQRATKYNPITEDEVVAKNTKKKTVYYHATKVPFEKFDITFAKDTLGLEIGEGLGPNKFYFAKKKSDAVPQAGKGKARIVEANLDVDKLITRKDYITRLGEYKTYKEREAKISTLDKKLLAEGYDGIDGGWEIAVFDANKIKVITPEKLAPKSIPKPVSKMTFEEVKNLTKQMKEDFKPGSWEPGGQGGMYPMVKAAFKMKDGKVYDGISHNIVGEHLPKKYGLDDVVEDGFTIGGEYVGRPKDMTLQGLYKEAVKRAKPVTDTTPKPIPKSLNPNRLNAMIPLDEVPAAVRNFIHEMKGLNKGKIVPVKGNTGFIAPDGMGMDVVKTSKLYRNKELFNKTGYWLGKDNKWRYELDPKIVKYSPQDLEKIFSGRMTSSGPLTAYLKNDNLFKNIPELKNTKVIIGRSTNSNPNLAGYYDTDTNTIHIGRKNTKEIFYHELQHAINTIVKSKFTGSNVKFQEDKLLSDMLQEIKKKVTNPEIAEKVDKIIRLNDRLNTKLSAHAATEEIEKIAFRKDKKDYKVIRDTLDKYFKKNPYEEYRKNPGEMEARLVEKRMNMTKEQRAKEPPWKTLDKMLVEEGTAQYSNPSKIGSILYGIGAGAAGVFGLTGFTKSKEL